MLRRWLLGWELVVRRNNPVIWGLELWFPFHKLLVSLQKNLWPTETAGLLEDESVANDQWFNQPCISNEAIIKIQNACILRASRLVVDRWRLLERSVPVETTKMPSHLPILCQWHLFSLPIPELYDFKITNRVMSKWMAWVLYCRKLGKPKESVIGHCFIAIRTEVEIITWTFGWYLKSKQRVLGTSNLQPVAQKSRWQPELVTGICVPVTGWILGRRLSPVNRIRIELNYRIPSWLMVWGNSPTLELRPEPLFIPRSCGWWKNLFPWYRTNVA